MGFGVNSDRGGAHLPSIHLACEIVYGIATQCEQCQAKVAIPPPSGRRRMVTVTPARAGDGVGFEVDVETVLGEQAAGSGGRLGLTAARRRRPRRDDPRLSGAVGGVSIHGATVGFAVAVGAAKGGPAVVSSVSSTRSSMRSSATPASPALPA